MKEMNQIRLFRTQRGMTQEELAEKLDVSRQTVAKWERGDTLPDVASCVRMADVFGIPVEMLARGMTDAPLTLDGKRMYGCVRVNDKGQITLPVNVREAFSIRPGDLMLVLADTEKGIALVNMGGVQGEAILKEDEA